jgi:hypothetical protein
MDAGVNNFLGLRSKPTAEKRHGAQVKQPVEGCCSKKAAQARRGEYAWYVRHMQPGFIRACAPRGAILER